jgi:hypothetical protein
MTFKNITDLKAALKIVIRGLEEKSIDLNLKSSDFQNIHFSKLGGYLLISGVSGKSLAKQVENILLKHLSTFTKPDERIYKTKNGTWIRLRPYGPKQMYQARTNDFKLFDKFETFLKKKHGSSFINRNKQEAQADLDEFAEEQNLELVTAEEYKRHGY